MKYGYFPSIGFSFCALIFAFLIVVMYIGKEKYKNTESKLFLILLFLDIGLIFLEFIYVYLLSILKNDNLFLILSCRLYLIGMIIWMGIFIYYLFVQLTRRYKDEDIKKNKRRIIFRVLFIIVGLLIIVSCFLKLEIYDDYSNRLYVFGGPATMCAYITAVPLVLLTLYIFFIKRRNLSTLQQRKPLLFSIIFIVGITFIQVFIKNGDFNIQNFQFTMILFSLYFTLENQDNKVLIQSEKVKEELEVTNKAQTEYLTYMSHEIRTPMSTIMGYSDSILREKNLTLDIVKQDTSHIHYASIHLLDLINNILDLSRIESKKEELVDAEYDVKTTFVDLNNLLREKLEGKDIKLELKVDPGIPKRLGGDYTKINKSIINIINYILSKREYGEIYIFALPYRDENKEFYLNLQIIDNIHLSKKEYRQFEEDFNNENDNKVKSEQLGLLIAKKYIKMLDSNIAILNNNGMLVYNLLIKQNIVDPNEIGDISHELIDLKDEVIDLKDKKILVVDDNKMNIKLINRLLMEYNPILDSCTNGIDAISKIQETKYDLVFLDHMMPGMDGVETLNKLKDLMKDLPPIIALTANAFSGAREQYMEYGFYDYLSKPFNVNELKGLLIKIFEK